MEKMHNITEAEWPIMRILWEKGSATAAEIVDVVIRERNVSMRTVKTLLRRLVAKKAVGYAIDPHDSRLYHYRPLVSKEQAVQTKSRNFLAHFYQNRAADLLMQFTADSSLTNEEIATLQTMLEQKKQG